MAVGLLPGSIISMTDYAADRLLKLDHGDAALLYLRLLRKGTLDGLNWPEHRLRPALNLLVEQGMAPHDVTTSDPIPIELPPPDYKTEEITVAMEDTASTFPSLADEVERRLGKKLSANELKTLYTLYDHFALPAEVILMLVGWCIEEFRRKYGYGRTPGMGFIRKEGLIWAKNGIDTMELAEAHIQRLTALRTREMQILRLLNIAPRPLIEQEKNYIAAWTDMGFQNDTIRLAYDRTILKKQCMDWGYMNAILRNWHEKGLHTVEAVNANQSKSHPPRCYSQTTPKPTESMDATTVREDIERMRRLMDEMKQKEG